MELKISDELIEPIVKERIASAVIEQLGNTDELLLQMVQLAMSVKVSDDGTISRYSSDNKKSFIEALAGKAIREAAREAIVGIVEKQKPAMQKAIEDELRKAPKKTAAAIVSAFLEGVSKPYKVKVDFTIIPE